MYLSLFLALLPVIVVAWLLLARGKGADVAGLCGLALSMLIAWLWFGTSLKVVFSSAFAGFIGSFPVSLVFVASIFQITMMQQTGALARVVVTIKGMAPGQQAIQILLVNMAFGVLLNSLGATSISIMPPIMIALGYPVATAILLPALGYTGMCIYALLGAPAVVYATLAGAQVTTVGHYFAAYAPVMTICVCVGLLLAGGGIKLLRAGIIPSLLSGVLAGICCYGLASFGIVTVAGVIAGIVMSAGLLIYVRLCGKPVYDEAVFTEKDKQTKLTMSLLTACSPWILLTVVSLLLNAPFLPMFEFTFKEWSMPISIIPNSPERLRLFWQAYVWVILSTLICFPFIKGTKQQFKTGLKIFARRTWRPFISAAVFFSIAYVMNHSGKNADWVLVNKVDNMINVIAIVVGDTFGKAYPFVGTFLGLLGGFISGSQSSGIAMFTKLHLVTAEQIGESGMGLVIAAASAIAAGISGVISPAKLQTCAASIDRIKEANTAMKPAFIMALAITAVAALMAQFWS